MKMKKVVALLAMLAVLCTAFSGLTLNVSAAVTLVEDYEPMVHLAGNGVTQINNNRSTNTLSKFESGFDLLNSKASWLYNFAWCKNLYDTYGKGYTCTNNAGYEVAVNKYGLVIDKSAAGNMKIPEGGYVLSGHQDYAAFLRDNVQLGDYIRYNKNETDAADSEDIDDTYDIYRTTDDSKFTDASKAFEVKKTDVLEIVEGGETPTQASQWNTTVLVKAIGTGEDNVANHRGYLVYIGGKEIGTIPDGYFALVLDSTPLNDDGVPYNLAQLFNDYAAPGSIVNISKETIKFRYGPDAAKRAARLMSGTTDSDVTVQMDYSADTIYNDAKTKYELVNTARMKTLYDNMVAIANAVQSMSTIEEMEPYMATLYQNYREMQELEFEKKPVEMRAVWWRPLENDRVQHTAAELDALIETNVQHFAAKGYNMLFVEAFYNSCTIFPTDSSFGYNGLWYSQNPYLVPASQGGYNSNLTKPYDMLQRTIDICKQYGMECHFWWEVLYVGYERHNVTNSDDFSKFCIGKTIESSIKSSGSSSKYYNWLNIGHDGSCVSGSVDSKLTRYWLNPGNTGVRKFLKNFMSQVCAKYDIQSIQLDYFRHPNDGIREFGYDSDTVAAFKAKYPSYKNVDLTTSEYRKNQEWLQFRADYITTLIGEMRTILSTNYPWVSLTTSPQPDSSSALRSDLQDVQAWLGNGYIDTIFPMAYGYHIPGYVTPPLVEQNAGRFVCVGVKTDYKNDELEAAWIRQIRHAGADGAATFGETIDKYAEYIWQEPAVTPTGNASLAATEYLNKTVNARAVKMQELGDISSAKKTDIQNKIAAAVKAIRLYGIESSEALTAINAISNVSGLGTNPEAALTADVDYLIKIRNNSRDEAKEDRWFANNDETLTIGGKAVASDNDKAVFSYTKWSDTLVVESDWATLTGTMPGEINMVLNNDSWLEFKNVTLGTLKSIEATDDVYVELTGNNTVATSKLASGAVTYCGTGTLTQNGSLVRVQGDADSNEKQNSSDIRDLMAYSVDELSLTTEQKGLCDADADGLVTTIDIRMFLDAWIEGGFFR